MTLFENEGTCGEYLKGAYPFLMTVKTSVDSEREIFPQDFSAKI